MILEVNGTLKKSRENSNCKETINEQKIKNWIK